MNTISLRQDAWRFQMATMLQFDIHHIIHLIVFQKLVELTQNIKISEIIYDTSPIYHEKSSLQEDK